MALFKQKPETQDLEALRDITDDVIEGDFVPYACHWTPYTLVTKNGEVLQTIKIVGFVHEQVAEEDEGDLRAKIREAILTCVDSTRYGIWIHTIRRKQNLQTVGEYKRDFAGYLNRFWNDRNDWEHQFANEVYITIVREGQSAKLFDLKGAMRSVLPIVDRRYRERYLDASAEKLNKVVENMLPILGRYGARRLGVVKRGDIYYSEPCEFLGKLITLLDIEFPVADIDLSHYLTDYDVTFGFNAMEVRMRSDGKRRFGSILTLKEYRELAVETIDRILQIPGEFIITQCFDYIGAKQALKGYEYQKKLLDISNATSLLDRMGLKDILSSNRGRPTDYGLHQMNVFLLADSLKEMEAAVSKAVAGLAALGMTSMREDIMFEECYWAQLPANFEFIRRLLPINTARIGGLANLNNFPAGQKDGNHWGAAVTTFHTAARTPYFFNFHEGDNGHTIVVGTEGAGKNVLVNFLLAQAYKYQGKLFIFDTGRSAEIFTRSLGGDYYNPWPGAKICDYAHTSLNPFCLEDTAENREFLRQWMLTLAEGATGALAALDEAIAQTMARPQQERRLGLCVEYLRERRPEIAGMFARWTGDGAYATLFDHEGESLALAGRTCGFEMGDVMAHPETLAPVLSYLLHRIMLALDGKPAIVAMNEAWALLGIPQVAPRLAAWLDMLRAKNAIAVLSTNNVEAACGSILNATLLEKVATQIYLPDEAADEAYAEAFGLTDKEVSYLTVMDVDDRHFLLKRGDSSIIAELNLFGMTDIVAVLSATPASLQLMEEMIAKHGQQPARWMPKFLEKI